MHSVDEMALGREVAGAVLGGGRPVPSAAMTMAVAAWPGAWMALPPSGSATPRRAGERAAARQPRADCVGVCAVVSAPQHAARVVSEQPYRSAQLLNPFYR